MEARETIRGSRMLKNEKDIIAMIEKDQWMIEVLQIAKGLNLPDWWICAGFVRAKIWDVLHGFKRRTPLSDVDVVYYDRANIEESYEKELEQRLKMIKPDVPWSVKNQARMHLINSNQPYLSTFDAISRFPETVTALGVRLDEQSNVVLIAPHGVRDVIELEVNPTPDFMKEKYFLYEKRVKTKNWPSIWHRVKVNYL